MSKFGICKLFPGVVGSGIGEAGDAVADCDANIRVLKSYIHGAVHITIRCDFANAPSFANDA